MWDREDFDGFCRTEYTGVVRLVYWMVGDRQEALDLAQEAFTRAFERWRTVCEMERPDA